MLTRRTLLQTLLALPLAPLVPQLPVALQPYKARQLGMSVFTRKLMIIQLARAGFVDHWTASRRLEIENT